MPDQAEICISASTPRQSPNIAAYRGSAAEIGGRRKPACRAGSAVGAAGGRPNCGAGGRGFESRLPPLEGIPADGNVGVGRVGLNRTGFGSPSGSDCLMAEICGIDVDSRQGMST